MVNVVDYTALDKKLEEIDEIKETIKKKKNTLKNPTHSKQLEDLEKKLKKEENDYKIELDWHPIRQKPLSIVAYDLTLINVFENRPDVVHQLAQPSLRDLPQRSQPIRDSACARPQPCRQLVQNGSS